MNVTMYLGGGWIERCWCRSVEVDDIRCSGWVVCSGGVPYRWWWTTVHIF